MEVMDLWWIVVKKLWIWSICVEIMEENDIGMKGVIFGSRNYETHLENLVKLYI